MRRAVILLAFTTGLLAQQPAPERLFREALDAQQKGNDALAIQKYEALIKLRPGVPEVHANLGAALAKLGRYDSAIRHYRTALDLAPANKALQFNLALAYYKQEQFSEAIKLLQPLQDASPADVRTALILADAYNRTGQETRTVALLSRLEQFHPDDMALKWLLGTAMIRQGQRHEGLERVDRVARQGKSPEACLLAGRTALEMQEYEIARDYAELALRLNPNLPGVQTLAGMTRQYLADTSGSIEAFRKAIEADANDFEAHLGLGSVLLMERDLDGAREHLTRALELRPKDKLALYQAGRLERAAGNLEAAAKLLESVVAADPKWAQPHIELSALYFRLNRTEDGERERTLYDKLSAGK